MKGTKDNFPEIFSDPLRLLVFHPHLWDFGSAEYYAVLGCIFGPLWAPYLEVGPLPPSIWACELPTNERTGPINYWAPQVCYLFATVYLIYTT